MKLTFAFVGMLLFITGTTVFLFERHAKAAEFPSDSSVFPSGLCFDELLLRWNQLAADSNKHIQTVEVNPEKHRKMHERIDKEFAAVKALACW